MKQSQTQRQNSWTEGSCTLMFDESNSAELRLDLSELRANGGQSHGGPLFSKRIQICLSQGGGGHAIQLVPGSDGEARIPIV